MALGSKIFRRGAFLLEKARTAASETTGWANSNTKRGLGTLDNALPPGTASVVSEQTALGGAGMSAFPWLTFAFKPKINTKDDESVTSTAFKSVARVTGKLIDGAQIAMYHRFDGIGRFLYWMFGWQSMPQKVIVIEGAMTGTPVANSTIFSDTTPVTPKTYKYIRTEVSRGVAHHVFSPTGATTGAPALGALASTTPVCNITVTAANVSPTLYECLYELDAGIRNLRLYTAAEQAILTADGFTGVSTWKKSPYATAGIKVSDYDLIYKNALCKGFSMDVAAADAMKFTADVAGYDEYQQASSTAGDGSDNWKLAPSMRDNMSVPFAHQLDLYISTDGATVGDTTKFLGASSVGVKASYQFNMSQDLVSGLALAEPVVEGKTDISMTATLSRHSSTQFMTWRDGLNGAQTPVCARLYARNGFLSNEILIKKATLTDAGPNDADTTGEDLSLSIGWVDDISTTSDNPWYTYLGAGFHKNAQTSPLVMRVRSTENINWMVAV